MPAFTGSDFSLESVTQLSLAVIRVRYTQDPLATSSVGANDALNVAQYSLAGPGVNAVAVAATVSGDPQAIDLNLIAPLIPGTWTLAVAGTVQTATARPLQAPTAIAFNCTLTSNTETVNPGAVNDDAERVLRKHLNPALKGKAWNALLAALAVGDKLIWEQGRLAFAQLFKSSASGIYLSRRANDDGVTKPAGIGMSDDLFREFAIRTTTAKLTQDSLLDILEIFYGHDSVRAYAETSISEPYLLNSGDDLTVVLDDRDRVRIEFVGADFGQINVAKAIEVAAAITRFFRANSVQAYAVAVIDPSTGLTRTRIYSGSKGLSSSVRVVGGKAQERLHFPDAIDIYNAQTVTGADAYSWVLSNPRPGVNRFSLTTGLTPKVDLSLMRVGDYVIIGTDMGGLTLPLTYTVTDVGVSYSGGNKIQFFEVGTDFGLAGSYVQASNRALLCFRPVRATTQRGNNRAVVVAQSRDGAVAVTVPATSQAVGRGVKVAAYGKIRTALAVSSFTRNLNGVVTVSTSSPHGLSPGNQVWVDEAVPETIAPAIIAGTLANPGLTDYSQGTLWGLAQGPLGTNVVEHQLTRLLDGRVLMSGGLYVDGSGNENTVTSGGLFKVLATNIQGGGEAQYQYRWDSAGVSPAMARHGASLVSSGLREGCVLASGSSYTYPGPPASLQVSAATSIYFPDGGAGTWVAGPAMTVARGQHVSVAYDPGTPTQIVLAGGAVSVVAVTAVTNVWGSATNTMTAANPLNDARCDAEAIAMGGVATWAGGIGYALICGGRQLGIPTTADANTWAKWAFDEDPDTTFADSTGNGLHTLTPHGFIAAAAPGKIGNCANFDANTGGDWWWETGNVGGFADTADMLGEWTFEGWVRPGAGTVLSFGGVGPSTIGNNAPLNIDFATTGGTGGTGFIRSRWSRGAGVAVDATTSVPLTWNLTSPTNWNHIAVVKRATVLGTVGNYDVEIWLNGVLVQTVTNIQNAENDGSGFTMTWALGVSRLNTTIKTPGLSGAGAAIDDVRVSLVARGATEIMADYSKGSGYANAKLSGRILNTCEVWDGANWVRAGSMTYARTGHRLLKLPDNRILAIGGYGYIDGQNRTPGYIKQAEIFDPRLGRWAPAGVMATARAWAVAEYLPSSKKIVVGFGENGTGTHLTQSEYLDVPTMTWGITPRAAATDTVTPFGVKSAALLNGGVLVVGGYTVAGQTPHPQVLVPGSDIFSGGGLNGIFALTSTPSSTQFTFQSQVIGYSNNSSSSLAIYPVGAVTDLKVPGPYIFDRGRAAAVTGTVAVATQDLIQDQQYRTLDVDDASVFPDAPGWLCLSFGIDNAEFPIQYLGRYSPTALLLDYGYKFKASHLVRGFSVALASRVSNVTTLTLNLNQGITDHGILVGAKFYFKVIGAASFSGGYKTVTARTATTIAFADVAANASATDPGQIVLSGLDVTLLQGKGSFSPPPTQPLGAFYATASPAGRVAAVSAVQDSVAAGFNVGVQIEYPGDRGLGGEGLAVTGIKISDRVAIWAGDDVDAEVALARGES